MLFGRHGFRFFTMQKTIVFASIQSAIISYPLNPCTDPLRALNFTRNDSVSPHFFAFDLHAGRVQKRESGVLTVVFRYWDQK